LIDEQEKLEEELQRLDDEMAQNKDIPNAIQTYQSDIKNFENYINETQAHNKSNEELLESLEKELNDKLEILQKFEEKK